MVTRNTKRGRYSTKKRFRTCRNKNKKTRTKYNVRYADNWPQIRARVRRLSKGKCTLCDVPGIEVHHPVYRLKDGSTIAGKEKYGETAFLLCKYHHSGDSTECAHHYSNWIICRRNPVLNNRNVPEYYALLVLCCKQPENKSKWVELYKRDRSAVLAEFLNEFERYNNNGGVNN